MFFYFFEKKAEKEKKKKKKIPTEMIEILRIVSGHWWN
jgi:hypothetical protein